jgi:hypothetical protein
MPRVMLNNSISLPLSLFLFLKIFNYSAQDLITEVHRSGEAQRIAPYNPKVSPYKVFDFFLKKYIKKNKQTNFM